VTEQLPIDISMDERFACPPLRRIVDIAQREPERWPWRKALRFMMLVSLGMWLAVAYIVGSIIE
jgi:hypothetical protein